MSELAHREDPGAALALGGLGAMTPVEVKSRVERVQDMRRAVMVEGVDYGVIPGTERPTLFAAGAEKMAILAGIGFTMTCARSSDQGATYRCTVTRGGQVVAECEGYAGYDEERFYQTAEHQRAKAEKRERNYAAKDRRAVNLTKFAAEAFTDYKAPFNTLIKMAQKRAKVGAIWSALALSGLFNVDEPEPDAETGEIPDRATAPSPDVAAPGIRRPVERRRRRDEVPAEVYDNEPEAYR